MGIDLATSSATGQTSATYVSALDTMGVRTREPSEDVVPPSPASGRVAGIAVPTSRMDVDESLRRMQEEFSRGVSSATQARRQQQAASSPRSSGFNSPRVGTESPKGSREPRRSSTTDA